MHAAEPHFLTDPNPLVVEIAIGKLKRYKSPYGDQIRADLFKQNMKYGLRSINSLNLFGIRKNCLIFRRSILLY
jgi:hypothetical protein